MFSYSVRHLHALVPGYVGIFASFAHAESFVAISHGEEIPVAFAVDQGVLRALESHIFVLQVVSVSDLSVVGLISAIALVSGVV